MKKLLLFLLFSLVLVSACSGGQDITSTPDLTPTHTANLQSTDVKSTPYWPTDGWRTSPPEEQEMDSKVLAQMFTTIDERQLDIHSVLVLHNGYIVAEKFFALYARYSA